MLICCLFRLLLIDSVRILLRYQPQPARDCANVKFVILGVYQPQPTALPEEAITNWFFHNVAEDRKLKTREKKSLDIRMHNISNGAEIQTHLKEANYGFDFYANNKA